MPESSLQKKKNVRAKKLLFYKPISKIKINFTNHCNGKVMLVRMKPPSRRY